MFVGVLGGGQLGRMLALAGYPLGLQFRLYDPAPESPAEHVAEFACGPFDDLARIEQFCRGLDVVTYEFENVPVATVQHCARCAPVYPPPLALATAQDRLAEKMLFTKLGIPTPSYVPVDSLEDLNAADDRLGVPGVLKTRRGGYDGKGQFVLQQATDAPTAWLELTSSAGGAAAGSAAAPALILEQFITFERELSLISVRTRDGRVAFYPLVENIHCDGILRSSRAPAPAVSAALQRTAEQYAATALHELNYVGILAIEFFSIGDALLANEMAPRVHNSGHWTIEGAATSQFENHLRAILGLPLGSTAAIGESLMLNLIGTPPPLAQLLDIAGAHVHLYGKAPRRGRKVGHVNVWGENSAELSQRAINARRIIGEGA